LIDGLDEQFGDGQDRDLLDRAQRVAFFPGQPHLVGKRTRQPGLV
jgi:hypothetical protein